MDHLNIHLGLGVAALLLVAAAVFTGMEPSDAVVDGIPATVRDNPGSYKPSHVAMTGYHPVYTGGGGFGVSTGGGYSSGK